MPEVDIDTIASALNFAKTAGAQGVVGHIVLAVMSLVWGAIYFNLLRSRRELGRIEAKKEAHLAASSLRKENLGAEAALKEAEALIDKETETQRGDSSR